MTPDCSTALASAKVLCRTLASAPAPESRARAIFAELVRADGWTPKAQAKIMTFGDWLATRPPPVQMRDRCKALLAELSAS